MTPKLDRVMAFKKASSTSMVTGHISHLMGKKRYISASARLVVTKLGKVVA